MNPPANWYPDPTGRHGQRYWDGGQWTEHVFTDGVQSVDPLDAVAGTDTAATEDAEASAVVTEEASSSQGSPPTLPRRVRSDQPSAGGGQLDDPVAADGLFDDTDAASSEVAPAAPDDSPSPSAAGPAWTPEAAETDQDETVAPEVEPDDVVANVEEVTEAADDAGEPDFSDAFVLAPETASRLVGRSEAAADTTTQDTDDADDADDATAASGVDDVEEPEGTVGTDDGESGADAPAAEADDATEAAEEPAPTPAAIDAPPPTMPAPAAAPAAGGLGITGDLVGGAFAEREEGGAVALQNARMLRCAADTGIIARQGTMVAYQGSVQFERQGAGGVGRALKRAATGEGLAMMRVTGNGDVFFADGGQHVFLLHLEGGPGLSVNGRNVLAFSASLQWDIERVKGASLLAGGLFNTTLTGTGWVALVADGEPVVLRTDDAPTYVDVNALVAWSGGLGTRIVNTVSAKSLVGLGSGEAFQMAFDGEGIVIVQPSEGPMGGPAAT